MFKLFKIVVDYRHPTVADGSLDILHAELRYSGDEEGLRKKMVDLNIITPMIANKAKIVILNYFASREGYIIQTGEK